MPKLILIVDDEPASLALMTKALQRAGHVVIGAASGVEARQVLGDTLFDVVVTDIFMPEMDGLELIRHICATSPATPIIAISGGPAAPSHNFLPIAAALGADMVLPKPVSPSALRYAVDEVMIDLAKGTRNMALAHTTQGSAMMGEYEAVAPILIGHP